MKDKPLAYEAYEKLADHYAAKIDTKPHNAYYDRPAMLKLWPDVEGQQVLDAGCGPGAYTEELLDRGALVTACDVSPRMLELAKMRVKETSATFLQLDLTKPLVMFEDQQFHFVNAPLCLDYIKDWTTLFKEFKRILKPNGRFQFSCAHPSFDAEYFRTNRYFSVEQVSSVWRGFGMPVTMPCYRRSLEEMFTPILKSGLAIEKVHEPLPIEKFKKVDPIRYKSLVHRPSFICVGARKI